MPASVQGQCSRERSPAAFSGRGLFYIPLPVRSFVCVSGERASTHLLEHAEALFELVCFGVFTNLAGLPTMPFRSWIKRDFKLFLMLFREVTGRDRNVLDAPQKKLCGF